MAHKFCGACGQPLVPGTKYPKTCTACPELHFRNPLPVAVGLVSLASPDGPGFRRGSASVPQDGLLIIKRAKGEMIGSWALPGGFIAYEDDNVPCESWEEALAREIGEEVGAVVSPDEIEHFCTWSSRKDNARGGLLIFGHVKLHKPFDFKSDGEVSEMRFVTEPPELAWPSHTEMARRFFAQTARPIH